MKSHNEKDISSYKQQIEELSNQKIEITAKLQTVEQSLEDQISYQQEELQNQKQLLDKLYEEKEEELK